MSGDMVGMIYCAGVLAFPLMTIAMVFRRGRAWLLKSIDEADRDGAIPKDRFYSIAGVIILLMAIAWPLTIGAFLVRMYNRKP